MGLDTLATWETTRLLPAKGLDLQHRAIETRRQITPQAACVSVKPSRDGVTPYGPRSVKQRIVGTVR